MPTNDLIFSLDILNGHIRAMADLIEATMSPDNPHLNNEHAEAALSAIRMFSTRSEELTRAFAS